VQIDDGFEYAVRAAEPHRDEACSTDAPPFSEHQHRELSEVLEYGNDPIPTLGRDRAAASARRKILLVARCSLLVARRSARESVKRHMHGSLARSIAISALQVIG
jgi:hypothetical protein